MPLPFRSRAGKQESEATAPNTTALPATTIKPPTTTAPSEKPRPEINKKLLVLILCSTALLLVIVICLAVVRSRGQVVTQLGHPAKASKVFLDQNGAASFLARKGNFDFGRHVSQVQLINNNHIVVTIVDEVGASCTIRPLSDQVAFPSRDFPITSDHQVLVVDTDAPGITAVNVTITESGKKPSTSVRRYDF